MNIIDISHILNNETPIFPGDYKTSVSVYKTIEKDYYNSYLLQSCLHTGTHIDMPMHLVVDERTAADFPPDCFCGRGVLLDVQGENSIDMKAAYERLIHEGDVVLLCTGWDAKFETDEYFSGYPGISDEFGDFLISKRIKILGMDAPSPDHSPYTIHKKLLESGIFILENLTNLHSLTGIGGFEVMALPLKISAEASFVRAVCVY